MLAIWGFAILSLTDNVWIYNLYYNNLMFALIGASYGVAGAQDLQISHPVDATTEISYGTSNEQPLSSPLFPPRRTHTLFPYSVG